MVLSRISSHVGVYLSGKNKSSYFFQQISAKYAKERQVSYLVAATLLIKHQAFPKTFISAIMNE